MPSDSRPDQDYLLNLFQQAQHYQKLAETEDPSGNLRRAIALYEESLPYLPPSPAMAGLHYNIGLAYIALSKHEQDAQNYHNALNAFGEALRFRTPDADLEGYILTQMNIAAVYNWLSREENPVENLLNSMKTHRTVLQHCTPENFPSYYYSEQMNMGNVYHELARHQDRDVNLQAALQVYDQALKFYSPQNYPVGYAIVKLNAGLVHKDKGDRPAAIAAWTEAERYFRQYGGIEQADQMLRWIEAVQTST